MRVMRALFLPLGVLGTTFIACGPSRPTTGTGEESGTLHTQGSVESSSIPTSSAQTSGGTSGNCTPWSTTGTGSSDDGGNPDDPEVVCPKIMDQIECNEKFSDPDLDQYCHWFEIVRYPNCDGPCDGPQRVSACVPVIYSAETTECDPCPLVCADEMSRYWRHTPDGFELLLWTFGNFTSPRGWTQCGGEPPSPPVCNCECDAGG